MCTFRSVIAITPMPYFVVICSPIIQSVRVQISNILTSEIAVTATFNLEFFW